MIGFFKTFKWTILCILIGLVILSFIVTDPASVGLLIGKITGNVAYGIVDGITSPLVNSLKPDTQSSRKITIDVLNSHDTIKLITREVQTNLKFKEVEKYGWLSTIVGNREGIVTADITFVYGVDVEKIKPEHITVSGDTILVDLPTLKPLYVVPDLESIQYRSESSLLNRLIDEVHDLSLKQRIYSSLKQDARRIALSKDLKPPEDEIFEDLENTLGPLIRRKTGRQLRFR